MPETLLAGGSRSHRPRLLPRKKLLVWLVLPTVLAVAATVVLVRITRDKPRYGAQAELIAELRGLVGENGLFMRPGLSSEGAPSWPDSAYGLGALAAAGRPGGCRDVAAGRGCGGPDLVAVVRRAGRTQHRGADPRLLGERSARQARPASRPRRADRHHRGGRRDARPLLPVPGGGGREAARRRRGGLACHGAGGVHSAAGDVRGGRDGRVRRALPG